MSSTSSQTGPGSNSPAGREGPAGPAVGEPEAPIAGTGYAGQLIAGCGAVLALLGPFSVWLAGAGLLLLVLGTVVAAPAGRYPGPFMVEWWTVLALAALACLIGFGLTFVVTAPGGIILVSGAVAALVAVGLGTPVETG